MIKILNAVGSAIAIVFVVALVMFGFYKLDQYETRKELRYERVHDYRMAKANTICGTGPVSIETHGKNGRRTSWLEISCPDGTIRVVS